MSGNTALLDVRNVKKYFAVRRGLLQKDDPVRAVKAVDDVSITIRRGETLGLIGESGCGKSTLSRLVLGLIDATAGEILFRGETVSRRKRAGFRKHIQMIFQDPYSSIDPRMSVERIIEEPLRVHTRLSSQEKNAVVLPILDRIGIPHSALRKYPHEFSGGQRQRIGIARALVLNPELLVCDEPVSALDVSIQSSILNLLREIQKEFGLTYLFISHDMSVVKHMSDRIAVMYLGKIVELARKQELFRNPLHPYTTALMNAIPVADPTRKRKHKILLGDASTPSGDGCAFANRCSFAMPVCRSESPSLIEVAKDHFVSCHLHAGRGTS